MMKEGSLTGNTGERGGGSGNSDRRRGGIGRCKISHQALPSKSKQGLGIECEFVVFFLHDLIF